MTRVAGRISYRLAGELPPGVRYTPRRDCCQNCQQHPIQFHVRVGGIIKGSWCQDCLAAYFDLDRNPDRQEK